MTLQDELRCMKKEILRKLIELAKNNPKEWVANDYSITIKGVTIWTENRPYDDMRFSDMSLVKKQKLFNWFEKRKLRKAIDSIGEKVILNKLNA